MPLIDNADSKMVGHVLVRDAETKEILLDKMNAIHQENVSSVLALGFSNRPNGHIHEMVFGNGASTVSGTGAITYFPTNTTGVNAQLYSQTYRKIVDDQSPLMPSTDRATNFITVEHTTGNLYTDIIVTCTLGYNEPSGQEAFDTATSIEGTYVFDELGLKAYDAVPGNGVLLTHVIFHPIQKAQNRVIEIEYTLRIYMSS